MPDADLRQPAGIWWRNALPLVHERLAKLGIDEQRARELSESVIIVCALRYTPASLEDAVRLALGEAALLQGR
jgi:hypothetical protein